MLGPQAEIVLNRHFSLLRALQPAVHSGDGFDRDAAVDLGKAEVQRRNVRRVNVIVIDQRRPAKIDRSAALFVRTYRLTVYLRP